jgi:hypothetical protein
VGRQLFRGSGADEWRVDRVEADAGAGDRTLGRRRRKADDPERALDAREAQLEVARRERVVDVTTRVDRLHDARVIRADADKRDRDADGRDWDASQRDDAVTETLLHGGDDEGKALTDRDAAKQDRKDARADRMSATVDRALLSEDDDPGDDGDAAGVLTVSSMPAHATSFCNTDGPARLSSLK